jgi:outer membrane protein OmpA-like peptidoglycan-associated protein
LAVTATPSYPVGTPDTTEASGDAPPSATALAGYQQSYVTNFKGSSLPSGWTAFNGVPGGDEGSLWKSSHVVVKNDQLELNAWQDPSSSNQWVTGGVCQCGVANTYGAYFVRSKMTGPGPTQVELLWPKTGWPPEIDFDETSGGDTTSIATLHYSSANLQVHQTENIDMTQWHTWGVIWSPTAVTYVVDGQVWGTETVSSEIPDQPMTLDITQQTWCTWGFACPTAPQSTDVNWVAEYTPGSAQTTASPSTSSAVATVVRPFARDSSILTKTLKAKIVTLANSIKANDDTVVRLTGYSDRLGTRSQDLKISRARALAVKRFLAQRLTDLGVTGVTITATGAV